MRWPRLLVWLLGRLPDTRWAALLRVARMKLTDGQAQWYLSGLAV